MNRKTGDDAIRGTDDDAAISRLSAVQTGYFVDPFASVFVRRLPSKRPPIIHRGTFIRTHIINRLMNSFHKQVGPDGLRQIVSFGAGTGMYTRLIALILDTRYFLHKPPCTTYYEVDFPEITSKKASLIKRHQTLSNVVGNMSLVNGGCDLHGQDYYLLSGDLRDFDALLAKLVQVGFDTRLPTLFLSECVFIYMESRYSDAIVEWIAKSMSASPVMMVTFEQILPNDAFGQVMLHNLKLRNLELPGIHAYPDLPSQKERYLKQGFQYSHALDMNTLLNEYISEEEKKRLDQLERLDEMEEWTLLSQHYCVSWGVLKGLDIILEKDKLLE